jgi:DNA-binding NarL/FixJ family response regulator
VTPILGALGLALFARGEDGVIQNLFDEQSGGGTGEGGRRNEYSLTQRENDILAQLAEGRSNREIAQSLFLSEKTVKAHLAAIFRKLGVTNRTQAAMMAVQMGVGPVPGALAMND